MVVTEDSNLNLNSEPIPEKDITTTEADTKVAVAASNSGVVADTNGVVEAMNVAEVALKSVAVEGVTKFLVDLNNVVAEALKVVEATKEVAVTNNGVVVGTNGVERVSITCNVTRPEIAAKSINIEADCPIGAEAEALRIAVVVAGALRTAVVVASKREAVIARCTRTRPTIKKGHAVAATSTTEEDTQKSATTLARCHSTLGESASIECVAATPLAARVPFLTTLLFRASRRPALARVSTKSGAGACKTCG